MSEHEYMMDFARAMDLILSITYGTPQTPDEELAIIVTDSMEKASCLIAAICATNPS